MLRSSQTMSFAWQSPHPQAGQESPSGLECQFWINNRSWDSNAIWVWKLWENQHLIASSSFVLFNYSGFWLGSTSRHPYVLQSCLTSISYPCDSIVGIGGQSESCGLEKDCIPPNPLRRYNSWDVNNTDIQGIARKMPRPISGPLAFEFKGFLRLL